MGVFDKVGDTLSSVSKDVVNKAKTGSDVNKIKQQIVYEEERITDFYTQLGKIYYTDKSANPTEQYAKMCSEIESRTARVERLKMQINNLKGIKICKNCGSVVANNFTFCGICGTKLPEEVPDEDIQPVEEVSVSNNAPLVFGKI